jgi:hypothetical protein
VEEVFGAGKRKSSLKLIMARLVCGAQTLILMAFLVMCAEKILRLLRLFFPYYFVFLQPAQALYISNQPLQGFQRCLGLSASHRIDGDLACLIPGHILATAWPCWSSFFRRPDLSDTSKPMFFSSSCLGAAPKACTRSEGGTARREHCQR